MSDSELKFVNLIPRDRVRRTVIIGLVKQWLIVCGVCTGMMLAVCASVAGNAYFARRSLQASDAEAAPVREMIRENTQLQQKLRQMKARKDFLDLIDNSRLCLAFLAEIGRHASEAGSHGEILINEFNITFDLLQIPTSNGDQPATTFAQEDTLITFSGEAIDQPTLSAFVERLNHAKLLSEARLESAVEMSNNQQQSRRFSIKAKSRGNYAIEHQPKRVRDEALIATSDLSEAQGVDEGGGR